MKKANESIYENNPFMVGLHGLQLFFEKAQPLGIMAIILTGISLVFQSIRAMGRQLASNDPQVGYHDWQTWVGSLTISDIIVFTIIIATALFVFLVVTLMIKAMFDYTSAQLARNKTVTLREAFGAASTHIGSYVGLQVLVGIKVILWSLLFIIPGVIMAVRYSLSGVSFLRLALEGTRR